jgi:hypothetical protein
VSTASKHLAQRFIASLGEDIDYARTRAPDAYARACEPLALPKSKLRIG